MQQFHAYAAYSARVGVVGVRTIVGEPDMRDSSAAEHRTRLTAEEIDALWIERLVSAQCSTGNGEMYIPQAAEHIPGWFIGQELGMAFQQGPAFVDVQATVADDNAQRKNGDRERLNSLIRAKLASTPSKIVRSRVKLIEESRGCVGCSSCVSDVRLRPRRSSTTKNMRAWTPGSFSRPIREEQAVLSFLRTAAAAIRRASAEERSAAYKQRKQRAAAARATMQARRAEQKAMRVAVRRAAEVVEGQ